MKNHLLMLRAFVLNKEIAPLVWGDDYEEFITKDKVLRVLMSFKWHDWINDEN